MDRHCINYSVGQSISVTQIIHLINFCLINEYKWDLTMVLIEVPLTLHCIVLNKTRGIQTWIKMVTYWFMTRVTIVREWNDARVTMVLRFWWPRTSRLMPGWFDFIDPCWCWNFIVSFVYWISLSIFVCYVYILLIRN